MALIKNDKWWLVIGLTCFLILLSYLGLEFHEIRSNQTYFDNLDEALKDPAQVKVLIIRNQAIDSLPEEISELVNLKVLNLANDHLKALPESIGYLHRLEVLSVENNQLIKLPSSIRNLKRLKVVNLGTNLLQTLPQELTCLDSLRTLNLTRNQIEKVNLKGFRNLQDLDLSENNIIELSSSMQPSSILKKLDLYNNQLTTLPNTLFTLRWLDELILSGNPLDKSSRMSYDNFLKLKALRK